LSGFPDDERERPINYLLQLMSYGRNVGSFAGALALAVLIWVAGPLIGIGPFRPLEPAWIRLLIIAAIFLTLGGLAGWRFYKRREAAKKLAEGIAAPNNESDARILSERMKDALATLKKAAGARGDYLYELPWHRRSPELAELPRLVAQKPRAPADQRGDTGDQSGGPAHPAAGRAAGACRRDPLAAA
jgi:hypothetical protein